MVEEGDNSPPVFMPHASGRILKVEMIRTLKLIEENREQLDTVTKRYLRKTAFIHATSRLARGTDNRWLRRWRVKCLLV